MEWRMDKIRHVQTCSFLPCSSRAASPGPRRPRRSRGGRWSSTSGWSRWTSPGRRSGSTCQCPTGWSPSFSAGSSGTGSAGGSGCLDPREGDPRLPGARPRGPRPPACSGTACSAPGGGGATRSGAAASWLARRRGRCFAAAPPRGRGARCCRRGGPRGRGGGPCSCPPFHSVRVAGGGEGGLDCSSAGLCGAGASPRVVDAPMSLWIDAGADPRGDHPRVYLPGVTWRRWRTPCYRAHAC